MTKHGPELAASSWEPASPAYRKAEGYRAAASVTTTWISQCTQSLRSIAEWRQREGEALFKEFINVASRLALDSLAQSMQSSERS